MASDMPLNHLFSERPFLITLYKQVQLLSYSQVFLSGFIFLYNTCLYILAFVYFHVHPLEFCFGSLLCYLSIEEYMVFIGAQKIDVVNVIVSSFIFLSPFMSFIFRKKITDPACCPSNNALPYVYIFVILYIFLGDVFFRHHMLLKLF